MHMVRGLFKSGDYFVQLKPDNQWGNNSRRGEFKEIWYIIRACSYTLCINTTIGEPDAPQDVKVVEIRDNRNTEDSCVFTLRLSPPSNIDPDDIMYYIDYLSQRDVISSTSYTFIALSCTPNLRVNVTAVNRCGSIGRSVNDIVPTFLPDTEGVVETPNNANVGKYILAIVIVICSL